MYIGGVGKIEKIGIDATSSEGTSIPASGGSDSKSSYQEISSSTSVSADSIIVIVQQDTSAAGSNSCLFDIAIGSAGNEEDILPNLLYKFGVTDEQAWQYYFPVKIPSGARISGRMQTSNASAKVRLNIALLENNFWGSPGAGKVIQHGADTANSIGVQIDAGATANTKGAWTEITSSLSEDIKAFCVGIGGNENNAMVPGSTFFVDIGIGAAASEEIIVKNISMTVDTREHLRYDQAFYEISIAAGTRIAARCQSTTNDATDRIIDVIIYGVS